MWNTLISLLKAGQPTKIFLVKLLSLTQPTKLIMLISIFFSFKYASLWNTFYDYTDFEFSLIFSSRDVRWLSMSTKFGVLVHAPWIT
jgi:hypothetical protein